MSGSLASHYAPRLPLVLLPPEKIEEYVREHAGTAIAVLSRQGRPKDSKAALWQVAPESPDDYALRLVEGAGIHPGYPLKPYPVAVDRDKSARRRATSPSSSGGSLDDVYEVSGHGTFVRVTERPYEHEHRRHRAVAAVARLVAAVVALRWERPSRRRR